MPFINPHEFTGFEKEVERIMRQLSKDGKAETRKNGNLNTLFGKKCKDLLGEYMDLASTNYRKHENKTIFTVPPDIKVVPSINMRGVHFHFKRLKL